MISALLAYDAAGNVIDTLDQMVALDRDGHATGLIDFDHNEVAGVKLRDIWLHSAAAGSSTWPEWLSGQAYSFRVELGPDKRISALVHKTSGHRRERAAVHAAITAVQPDATGARDIRHLVGGPGRPLLLDEGGRTLGRPKSSGTPAHLVLIGR
jgi:hypothetical protein